MMSLCTTHIKRDLFHVKCQWSLQDPDVLLVGSSQISIKMVEACVKSIMKNSTDLLRDELLCGLDPESLEKLIRLECIEDDPRDDQDGFSFLSLPCIAWTRDILLQQLLKDNNQQARFLIIQDHKVDLNREAANRYLDKAQELLELLMTLIQLTSGNPARATEVRTVQWKNTGSLLRSIFIHEAHLMILTVYNKSSSLTQTQRPIARFLPTHIGRLLILFLALVLPFTKYYFIFIHPSVF